MEAPRWLKDALYPSRGDLRSVTFTEAGREMRAFVPDDEVWGLTREMLLQRVYEPAGGFPSGLVVDAGAHVGLFTLVAACHARRVIAIEPDPVNVRVLELNVAVNGLDNVTVVHAALWHERTEVPFRTSWHTTGGSVGSGGDVSVATITLDEIVDAHGPVDFLKLDVEGAEEVVLPASRRLGSIARLAGELHLTDDGQERPMLDALEAAGLHCKLVPAKDLYRSRDVARVVRNWRAVDGQKKVKLGVIAYLLAPLRKPRRPPGSRDMPLLLAERG